MNTKRYMISDASKRVDVESHVLRYWEEELGLAIPRNELGHRYYTEENIKLLQNIKVLKEQGFQLKAIKMVIPELETTGEANLEYMLGRRDELNRSVEENLNEKETLRSTGTVGAVPERRDEFAMQQITAGDELQVPVVREQNSGQSDKPCIISVSEDKMQQFQLIMSNIVSKALQENNLLLGREVSERVSDNVLKEMDYLMRMREEKEDERFKHLDETIRAYQKNKQPAAKSTNTVSIKTARPKKKKKMFRKAVV